MNRPSVGRIVHYKTPNGIAPAIVTLVHGTGDEVALQVFDAFGGTYSQMKVAAGEDMGQWSWPPKV